jgi:hypothetical protein
LKTTPDLPDAAFSFSGPASEKEGGRFVFSGGGFMHGCKTYESGVMK